MNGLKKKFIRDDFPKQTLSRCKQICLFDQNFRFWVTCCAYVQILRSIGLHEGQHIKTLVFQTNHFSIGSWGCTAIEGCIGPSEGLHEAL